MLVVVLFLAFNHLVGILSLRSLLWMVMEFSFTKTVKKTKTELVKCAFVTSKADCYSRSSLIKVLIPSTTSRNPQPGTCSGRQTALGMLKAETLAPMSPTHVPCIIPLRLPHFMAVCKSPPTAHLTRRTAK